MSAIRPGGDAFKAQEAASTQPTPMTSSNYKPGDAKIDKGFIEMMRKGHEGTSSATPLTENHKVQMANKSDSFISKIINFITSLFSSKADYAAINKKMAESLTRPDDSNSKKEAALKQINEKYDGRPSATELKEASKGIPPQMRDALLKKLEDAKNQAILNANGGKDSLQEDLGRIGLAKANLQKLIVNLNTPQGDLATKKTEYLGKIETLRNKMNDLKDETPAPIKQRMENFRDRENQFNNQLTEARNIVNGMTTAGNTQDADKAIRQLEQRILAYEGEVRFQQSRDNPNA